MQNIPPTQDPFKKNYSGHTLRISDKEVFHTPQSSRCRASPSDGVVVIPRTTLFWQGGSYPETGGTITIFLALPTGWIGLVKLFGLMAYELLWVI